MLDLNRTGQSSLSPYFDPQSFVVAGDSVFFPAWSIAEGYELWRSNGVESGTRLLADLLAGPLSSSPAQLTPAGSRVFFLASDDTGTYQAYVAGPPAFVPTRLTNFDPAASGPPAILGVAGADGQTLILTYPVGGQLGLWAIREANQTPVLLRTFASGPTGPAFGGTDVVARNSRLYLVADDGLHGRELWRTDGTVAGTVLLADIVPGVVGSNPVSLAAFEGRILFSATTPGGGAEPWVCDAGGARQLADIESPADPALGSAPNGFAQVGARFVFSANSGATGRELWITDASISPAATHLLRDINPGPGDGLGPGFQSALISGRLFFAADDGVHGLELWSTDGTADGTRLEVDLRPGAIGSAPASLVPFRMGVDPPTTLLFQAAVDDNGYRIWKASGPDVAILADLPYTDDDTINRLSPRPMAAITGSVLFPAFRLDCGLELFRADPASGTATLVADIRGGTTSSAPAQLARLGRSVIFSARNELGAEPWVSDGTGEHTRMLADLAPGRTGSSPASLIPGRDFAMFRATTAGVTGWWRSDAVSGGIGGTTPEGALSLQIAEPVQSAAPRAASLNGLMVFAARTPETGDEPFVTDGVQTRLLKNIAVGTRGSSPFCFFRLGDRVVFFATVVPGIADIWSTAGTPESTELVATIINPIRARVISTTVRPVVAGPRLFFVASDGTGDELWTTNGEESGTHVVADIIPGLFGSSPANLCASQSPDGVWRLFFSATDDEAGAELWVCKSSFDGPLDPHRVRDISPGPAASAPFSLTADPLDHSGIVYFVATDGVNGFELWSTDGDDLGTRRMTDLHASANQAAQSVLGVIGSRVYLRVVDPGATSFSGHLFIADDSASGAAPVLDAAGQRIVPGSNLLRVNSRAFLAVSDPIVGTELAVIDLCPADFDNSGAVGIDDVFAFLAAWLPDFGRIDDGLAADTSGDGRIGIDDLFGFLGAYFGGCP